MSQLITEAEISYDKPRYTLFRKFLKVELNVHEQATHSGCTEQYVLVGVESSLVEPGLDAVQSAVVPERRLCPLRQVGNGLQSLRRATNNVIKKHCMN